jgi:hypothetical protein
MTFFIADRGCLRIWISPFTIKIKNCENVSYLILARKVGFKKRWIVLSMEKVCTVLLGGEI